MKKTIDGWVYKNASSITDSLGFYLNKPKNDQWIKATLTYELPERRKELSESRVREVLVECSGLMVPAGYEPNVFPKETVIFMVDKAKALPNPLR